MSMEKKTTREIGDELEDRIYNELLTEMNHTIDTLCIKKTKGSGNKRGDGDIKIELRDEYHSPLIILDGKNSGSSNSGVPSRKDVDKTTEQANNHETIIGGIVVRGGIDGDRYAACTWETMKRLIIAAGEGECLKQ